MIRRLALALAAALLGMTPAVATDRDSFTHYVVALSWNATWCALEGDARDAPQCDRRHDHGFLLHGLWPQGERDWPEYCRTRHRDPTRSQSAKMADVFGSAGLAWYQWKKHGRCADLPATEYYALAREAYRMVNKPKVLRKLDKRVRVPVKVIEDAFLEANPNLKANQISVTCRDGMVQEVRVCMSKALVPRACTPSVERGCRSSAKQVFPPMR